MQVAMALCIERLYVDKIIFSNIESTPVINAVYRRS